MDKSAKINSNVSLQPHQQRVLDKLDKTDGLLLYHGLGSGKTLSSIAGSEGLDTNVVVPAALRKNYAKEVDKFTNGSSDRNVVSYANASLNGLPEADTLILDEAHRIKNADSARSKELVRAAKRHRKRILLTGTPISNNPADLAPLIKMLNPGAKGVPLDAMAFNEKFVEEVPEDRNIFSDLFNTKRTGSTFNMINGDILRKALKGRVDYHPTDQESYPTRNDTTREIEMSPSQEEYYDTVTGAANPVIAYKIENNMPLTKQETGQLNAFLQAARQVSNTTVPYGGTEVSPKVKGIVQDFMDASKKNPAHRGIVYSNYLKGGIVQVSKLMKEKRIKHAMFTGEMSDEEKAEAVKAYNTGKIKALLLSGAGAEGIDLKNTRSIQLMEPHWNKSRIDQVIGRGIRYKSHDSLPKEQRVVNVIKYLSTLPKSTWQRFWNDPARESADQYLTHVTEKKQRLLNQFNEMLQQVGSEHGQGSRKIK